MIEYQTKVNQLANSKSTIPIYEERGYKIGTGTISKQTEKETYVNITIEKYQGLIQKLVEERLVEVKEIRCSQIKYEEFISK